MSRLSKTPWSRKIVTLLLATSHSISSPATPQEMRRAYSATALSIESAEPLDVERHVEFWQRGRLAGREVRYEDTRGRLIAEKVERYDTAAAAPLLRLAVDPIELVYSAEGRLLEFQGLVNLVDERGGRYRARIVFDCPPSEPVAAGKTGP